MRDQNPLLKAVTEQQKQRRMISEAFEKWFTEAAPLVNPLLTRDDAQRIFEDAFQLGHGYGMSEVMLSVFEHFGPKE